VHPAVVHRLPAMASIAPLHADIAQRSPQPRLAISAATASAAFSSDDPVPPPRLARRVHWSLKRSTCAQHHAGRVAHAARPRCREHVSDTVTGALVTPSGNPCRHPGAKLTVQPRRHVPRIGLYPGQSARQATAARADAPSENASDIEQISRPRDPRRECRSTKNSTPAVHGDRRVESPPWHHQRGCRNFPSRAAWCRCSRRTR